MSTKIHVGGLASETTVETLKAHFEQHGAVADASIVPDHRDKSKGIGYIEMNSAEEAQKAITALNTKDLEGRRLTVNQARPQTNRS